MTTQWTKLLNRFYDGGKMKILRSKTNGNHFALIYLMMQSLAGECNCGGGLCIDEAIPHTPETLGREFGFKPSVVKKAMDALVETRLIYIINGIIYLADWEENQSAEKLEIIRKQNRERQRKRRERLKGNSENITLPSRDSHGTEEDKEIEKEKELEGDGEDIYKAAADCFTTTA